jgi:DnaJ like chaperone protein
MFKYEKWLGAGLGWAVGGPVGGLLGFFAGKLIEQGNGDNSNSITQGLTEFEINLAVLASHLIKIDGRISLEEVSFVTDFLNTHFDSNYSARRTQMVNHCMQKEYDLSAACDQIRINTPQATRIQVIHFLFDVALCDGELNERENYFIFRIAGYLNVNDVEFKRIKTERTAQVVAQVSVYEVLGVQRSAGMEEIRNAYRKLVLKYHPDRNKTATEQEKKELSIRFQRIHEAYEQIKKDRE